jgi:hypothetical protein
MNLDINNGEFYFEKYKFLPKEKFEEVKNKFVHNEFQLQLKNNQWEIYRLDISEKYIIRIFFLNEFINLIEIYPKNVEEKMMPSSINSIIERMGGEKKCPWGKIESNIDRKAGYMSVVIRYN